MTNIFESTGHPSGRLVAAGRVGVYEWMDEWFIKRT